ncbi:MAG TPA: DegV family protein, partial [Longilinea sp.]|nr:DegV family protein [Longilinea sp.]
MKSACIITDGFAQTTQAVFPGRSLVRYLPIQVVPLKTSDPSSTNTLQGGISARLTSRLVYPTEEMIAELLFNSAQEFDEILVIITSSALSPLYGIVEEVVNTSPVCSRIKLIDSSSISIGLGYLVEKSAQMLVAQKNISQIEETIRSIINHIYSIFCIPNLSNLYLSGFLDDAQAMVGEILGLYPLFTLEEGRLTPLQKVKNSRAALDYFQEFID